MASRGRPHAVQAHGAVRVYARERVAADAGSEPVDRPPVPRPLVHQDVVDAGADQGPVRGAGASPVEPSLPEAEGVVGHHGRFGVEVGERVDRDNHAVVRPGEPVEPLDRWIGRDASCQVHRFALGAGDNVQRRLADDVGEGALAVVLVQLQERRQGERQSHQNHCAEERRRDGYGVAGGRPRVFEAGGCHDGEWAERGYRKRNCRDDSGDAQRAT